MTTCSIVIPVFNHASLTRLCLNALLTGPPRGVATEIVVVDDASTDITPELLASYGDRIRRVRHERNAGFATSCNDGAAVASGDLLVFLNNDTIPHPGWLDALVAYAAAHPAAGAVGSKLLFPDDTIQHAGVVIARQDRIPRHIYRGFPADHPAVNRSRRFQAVTAACMLVRREAYEQAGGFDRAFVNGYEDVDFCLRLGELGYEVHYCHESVLVHLESASRGRRVDEALRNTELYRERWMGQVRPDDLDYYLADGLIELAYPDHDLYPLRLTVAPDLATLDADAREGAADRLLGERARQAWRLTSENVNLRLRLQELAARPEPPPPARIWVTSADQDGPPPQVELVARGAVHAPSGSSTGRLVSIIMPVKDGAERLRELLPRVLEQRTDDQIELIAIDSGSRDDTIDVLRQFEATVLRIDPAAFDHGLTRTLAARHARGALYVFLNQTATPVDEHWLANLVAPLDADQSIVGVCSRIVPRPDADPLVRRDVLRDPSGSPEPAVRSIQGSEELRGLGPEELRLRINFHTVSAAIRPQIFARIPFRRIRMGEDILWAREVLEAGYGLRHEPTSRVYHSHAYTPLELLQRNVDDGLANREIVGRDVHLAEVFPALAALMQDDWRYLERECGLTGDEIERWRVESAVRRAAQMVGQWIGANGDRATAELARQLSLTEAIKSSRAARDAPGTR